jgi:glutamate carboxypeptidase
MKRSTRSVLLLVALAVAPGLVLAQDVELERRLVEHVDAHREEALSLLERIVNINSGTLNFEGVREVGRVLGAEFEELGFEVRWVDGAAFDRAGHLVAEWPPSETPDDGRPHLLLIGHLDTVFEPDSPFQRFERIDETSARGPGTTDMKGGDVVMIYAIKALAEVGALDDLRLTVVMTGDEEKSGRPLSLAREALVAAAESADAAIGFEDGDSNPETAVISRRGGSGWVLKVTGVPAHSSQVFTEEVGSGAIYEAARILTAFHEELKDEPVLTFNPGAFVGGTDVEFDPGQSRGTAFGKSNVVAEHAVVAGDLRALSLEQYRRVKAKMKAIVADHLPQTQAEITFSDGYPPLAPSDGNKRLLALYDQVSRDLGFGPVTAVDPRKAGAADISFVAGYVPMALDGIGLMGSGGHTVDEITDLSTLPMQTKRAAVLLHRLGGILGSD